MDNKRWVTAAIAAVTLVAATLLGSTGVAHSAARVEKVASQSRAGSVTIINTRTDKAIATIRTGGVPNQIVVTPDGKTAYVLNEFSYPFSVTMIKIGTSITARRIRAGSSPIGIAITPDGRTVYITRQSNGRNLGSVLPVSARTGVPERPITLSLDNPGSISGAVTVVPNGTLALAAEGFAGNGDREAILPIRTFHNTPGRVIVFGNDGPNINAMSVTPDSRTVFVLSAFPANPNRASVLNPIRIATAKVGRSLRLPAGVGPMVMTPNGRILYVADRYDGVVFAVKTATNVIVKRINMGFPSSLVVSPDGKTVYAAAADITTGACEVIPIVVATNTARPPILVPNCASLDAVAITPSGRKLYVADYSLNQVFPIDTASGAVDQPITVGPYPEALAVTRDGSRLYVVNSDAG